MKAGPLNVGTMTSNGFDSAEKKCWTYWTKDGAARNDRGGVTEEDARDRVRCGQMIPCYIKLRSQKENKNPKTGTLIIYLLGYKASKYVAV